ncbi:MAG: phenylalanine--tRNA ligase subunit beta, partial [Dehalococcoidia bacterium]|nr:phenylalanine--tRNA ligase subunit beta [Dehalococcoidia bacterium]
IGANWQNVFVGEIIGIGPHPNADKLRLATVTLGQEPITVVCGAPNIAVGQKIAFARVGAKLFDGHSGKYMELKPAKIRGVQSEGMVCSEKELGISDSHEGILVLAQDAPIGQPLADYMGDTILDVTVTPNRPDCLNLIGIAREVASFTGAKMRLPQVQYLEDETATKDLISIEILNPDLCPRYCAGIIKDVKIGPSPRWMQERLLAAGMRPINNIVDITNFVMFEYGQPLHAFDYYGIGGQKIIVRRAGAGEKMTTLDGQERQLTPEMLVIADQTHPVALAGVMGGADSEVTEVTTTILLESANFNNVSIRRTSRGLGLISEASLRFDKGLSQGLPMPAIRRAIQLMVDYAGGKATQGIVDAYPGFTPAKSVTLTGERAKQVLGIDFGMDRIRKTLESLGFECQAEGASELSVSIPYWRTDIKLPDDLIEEVARIIGYSEIPTTMLSGAVPYHNPSPLRGLRMKIQDILTGCGMQEVINYSLTGEDMLKKLRYQGEFGVPMKLANPMSRDQELLRLSLRGGLLTNFVANQRQADKGVMLFEIGKIYLPRQGDLPIEKEMLAGIVGGGKTGKSWLAEKGAMDFFFAKGILETMFRHLGIEATYENAEDVLLLPGKTACVKVNGERIGVIGELHPDVAGDFDISLEPVCLFEIETEKLLPMVEKTRVFQSIPRYPSNDRDLALIVDDALPAQKVRDILKSFPQIADVMLFDVFRGGQVPVGKKSLAFAVRYQSMEKTLADDEVDKIQHKILARLEREVGAVLRQ